MITENELNQHLASVGIYPDCRKRTQELYDHDYAIGYGCPVILADKAICPCRCHSERDFDCTEDVK